MRERRRKKAPIPVLSHREAAQHLLDYSLGRLEPALNAAMEQHVRSCSVCQRQGLSHVPTEKREIARKLARVRPTQRRRISRRGQVIMLVLTVIVIAQLGVYRLTSAPHSATSGIPFFNPPSVFNPSAKKPLKPSFTFGNDSEDTRTLSVSPDGTMVAGAVRIGTTSQVLIWKVTNGSLAARFTWPHSALPGALAWSLDGAYLAGADGASVVVWKVASGKERWDAQLPAAPAVQIYDANTGDPVSSLDPSSTFKNGALLLWASNGKLTPAPAGAAGATGIVAPGTPLVGLWQVTGSHVYQDAGGTLRVGLSPLDIAAHHALLTWSPDGQYVLWATVSQPVAVAASGSGSSGVAPPDATVADIISSDVKAASTDLLVWFSPDGSTLLQCDRSQQAAGLQVEQVSTGHVLAAIPGICDSLNIGSVAWLSPGSSFVVAIGGHPLERYALAHS